LAYEKFLIIAGRKIWKAAAQHELNCQFVYLGEGAVLAGTDLEALHFKKKNFFCKFIHIRLLHKVVKSKSSPGDSLITTNLHPLCSSLTIIP